PADVTPYQKWNPVQDDCRALGEAYGVRRITEITLNCVDRLPEGPDRYRATALVTLYMLEHIATLSGPYLSAELLTAQEARSIPALIAKVCAQLLPEVPALQKIFALPPGVQRAPALADDYPSALSAASATRSAPALT